jgi:hypothetical protein
VGTTKNLYTGYEMPWERYNAIRLPMKIIETFRANLQRDEFGNPLGFVHPLHTPNTQPKAQKL